MSVAVEVVLDYVELTVVCTYEGFPVICGQLRSFEGRLNGLRDEAGLRLLGEFDLVPEQVPYLERPSKPYNVGTASEDLASPLGDNAVPV